MILRAGCKDLIYFEMTGWRCPIDGHYVLIGSTGYGELSCRDQESSSVWKFLWEWLYQRSTFFEKFPIPQPQEGNLLYVPCDFKLCPQLHVIGINIWLTIQMISHENQALGPHDLVSLVGNQAWRSNRSIIPKLHPQIIRIIWELVRNSNSHTLSPSYWIRDSWMGPSDLCFINLPSGAGYHW